MLHDIWALEETAFDLLMSMLRETDIAAISAQGMEFPDSTLVVKDSVAIIPIQGVLTKGSDTPLVRMLFGGGTSYFGIIAAIKEANDNPEVKSIELHIDSPGGSVNGMFDAAKAIKESGKSVTAIVSGMAASAAYVLASQANQIKTINEADRVGSIGTQTRLFTSDNVHTITSTNAPFKAPDPRNQDGIDKIKEELDMVHVIMVRRIAEGRNTIPDIVNREFGQGLVLTAELALRRKMIDVIEDSIVTNRLDEDDNTQASTSKFQDFEILDIPFSSRTAIKRIREATGSQENPSEDFRQGFFWFDRKDASNFAAYKLPFVDISDGKMVASRKAINAANAAMQGKRGGVDIPEADRPAVQRHIDRYKAKIDKMDKEANKNKEVSTMSLETLLTDNPEARAELDARIKAAVDGATTAERSRVCAHLENMSHSPEVVVKAIKEGDDFGPVQMSAYMNAMTNTAHGKKKTKDNPGAVTTDDDLEGDKGEAEKVAGSVLDKMLAQK